MRIQVRAVGRTKTGPERDLFDDYARRFNKIGPGIGLRGLTEVELESGGGLEREGERLLTKLPENARIIRLDEHGRQLGSKAFATELARYRDDGIGDMVFLIGGAAGYSRDVINKAPETIAFGPQTWPHRLVRAMLAEQLYRAASILAGTPYHKA